MRETPRALWWGAQGPLGGDARTFVLVLRHSEGHSASSLCAHRLLRDFEILHLASASASHVTNVTLNTGKACQCLPALCLRVQAKWKRTHIHIYISMPASRDDPQRSEGRKHPRLAVRVPLLRAAPPSNPPTGRRADRLTWSLCPRPSCPRETPKTPSPSSHHSANPAGS